MYKEEGETKELSANMVTGAIMSNQQLKYIRSTIM